MRRVSEIMADKPVPASKRISFWVNHLTKHDADHLRMFELSYAQYIMFYIFAFIFFIILLIFPISICVLQIQHMYHYIIIHRFISLIQNRMTDVLAVIGIS